MIFSAQNDSWVLTHLTIERDQAHGFQRVRGQSRPLPVRQGFRIACTKPATPGRAGQNESRVEVFSDH